MMGQGILYPGASMPHPQPLQPRSAAPVMQQPVPQGFQPQNFGQPGGQPGQPQPGTAGGPVGQPMNLMSFMGGNGGAQGNALMQKFMSYFGGGQPNAPTPTAGPAPTSSDAIY